MALYAGYNHSKVGDNQGVAVNEMTRSGRTYGDSGDLLGLGFVSSKLPNRLRDVSNKVLVR